MKMREEELENTTEHALFLRFSSRYEDRGGGGQKEEGKRATGHFMAAVNK